MLAAGRVDVADLNDLARARLRVEGAVERRELVAGEHAFSVGDWVMTTRNDYPLGILNGRRGIVTAIDPDGLSLTATVGENGYPVKLSRVELDNGYLDHSYAMTIHKAQGLTCDTVHVLGDETLYREAAYTALSRGRLSNHLHLAPNVEADDSHLPEEIDEQGLDALSRALANSRQQQLASIDLRNLPADSASTNADIEPNLSVGADWGIEL